MKTKTLNILIVEDDKYFRLALKEELTDYGIISEASNKNEAIEKLQREYFDIVLIDLDLDEKNDGIELVKMFKNKKSHVIVLSAKDDDQVTIKSYENGCDHFLNKIYYKKSLKSYFTKYIKNTDQKINTNFFKKHYITQDELLIKNIKELTEINIENKSILITGDTGVGKSYIAKHIHNFTYDSDKPFIHINCSEISDDLIESELFGHLKGSFTGAISDKVGKLSLANGGTLFLDEIGTISISMQKKLLKAIDEKTFYPVGSNKLLKSEFTLITATCEDLFEKIHRNEFRKDFFFRISGFNLTIKSLKERKEDIPLLIKHFIQSSYRRFVIKEETIEMLKEYSWPGNVRELKKTVDNLSLLKKGIIEIDDLPSVFKNNTSNQSYNLLTNSQQKNILEYGLKEFIKNVEEEIVNESLIRNNGKITHCIKELQISTSAFYRIFNKL